MAQPSNGMTTYEPKPPAALAPIGTGETASTVLAAQAKALVSARFEIAIRQPRDLDKVRARLVKECHRPGFARAAIYAKPIFTGRGGGGEDDDNKKFLEGPSIRFAEAAIQSMGNLAIDTPTIYDDDEKRIMRVTVSDMETNVTHSKDVTIMKRVERKFLRKGQTALKTRSNTYGDLVYMVEATDDQILNQENALVSKALRTTGLRLVPGWLIDECMALCRATRENEDAADPDAAQSKLFDAFLAIGVQVDDLKHWLGRNVVGTLQPQERTELGGIYNAIKEGETTWREVLDAKWEKDMDGMAKRAAVASGAAPAAPPPPAKGNAGVKAAIARGAAAAPADPPADPAPAAPAEPTPYERLLAVATEKSVSKDDALLWLQQRGKTSHAQVTAEDVEAFTKDADIDF